MRSARAVSLSPILMHGATRSTAHHHARRKHDNQWDHPSQFIESWLGVLASFWPAANADPPRHPVDINYRQVIPGTHDGYIYRARVDYNSNESNKFYFSYQFGSDTALDQGNGAHIYWTPGNSIPYPGGGCPLSRTPSAGWPLRSYFNATLTNEFIASWGYGSFPSGPPNADGALSGSTLDITRIRVRNGIQ